MDSLNRKKYRHKKTGRIATTFDEPVDHVPLWLAKIAEEWETIEERWELKVKENKELYFVNTTTNKEFHKGDKITIKSPNTNFGDLVRDHIIDKFHIQPSNDSLYKNIHVSFVGYDIYDRTLSFDEIINLSR